MLAVGPDVFRLQTSGPAAMAEDSSLSPQGAGTPLKGITLLRGGIRFAFQEDRSSSSCLPVGPEKTELIPHTHSHLTLSRQGTDALAALQARQCFPGASRDLCADRPPEAKAITPGRNDCANKERGGLQEPCLGPKPPVNETSWGERASRVSGGGADGAQSSRRPAVAELFIRRQRKDFALCTEVKLKVSRGNGRGIYEVRRQPV